MELSDYIIIPSVFLTDVFFLALVFVGRELAIKHKRPVFRVLGSVMLFWITLEIYSHVAMEQAAASLLFS